MGIVVNDEDICYKYIAIHKIHDIDGEFPIPTGRIQLKIVCKNGGDGGSTFKPYHIKVTVGNQGLYYINTIDVIPSVMKYNVTLGLGGIGADPDKSSVPGSPGGITKFTYNGKDYSDSIRNPVSNNWTTTPPLMGGFGGRDEM
jgi:hypothetical protein